MEAGREGGRDGGEGGREGGRDDCYTYSKVCSIAIQRHHDI